MEIDSSRYEPHVQLHGFSDASERAYAMVVYVRSNYNDGQFEVGLVPSKTRVAPIKRQTIPRLKLLGALILAHLANKLKSLWTVPKQRPHNQMQGSNQ